MKKQDYLALFIFEIMIILLVGAFQKAPGYMDAEYYFSGGRRLAEGFGFSEDFLWNYLDDPQGLPHPSHGYWMPFASILTAIGMAVMKNTAFSGGRVLFIVLTGAIPPISAFLSYQINKRRDFALLSGIMAALPGFYLSYLGTTDTFGLTMVLGGLFFILIGMKTPELKGWQEGSIFWGMGLLAGFMHFSRVDGVVWLVTVFVYIFIEAYKNKLDHGIGQLLIKMVSHSGLSIMGYLMVMGPWMVRNYGEFGTLLSPGGLKSLWITSYDELYAYPASILNMSHWLNSGMSEIINARSWAGWINIQSMVVVEGEIFLTPLMVWGLWKNRQLIQVKVGALAWLAVFTTMTLVFPYQGARGGFFHSSSSFQPLLWTMVPAGFDAFLLWGKKVRNWNYSQAKIVFQWGMLGLACFLSIAIVSKRVIGGNFSQPEWNNGYQYYLQLDNKIDQTGIMPDEIVMINNPPGFYLASNRPCIVIPDGVVEQVLSAARRYNAKYLILESNHPAGLQNLYNTPGDQPGLKYLFSFQEAHFFQVDSAP